LKQKVKRGKLSNQNIKIRVKSINHKVSKDYKKKKKSSCINKNRNVDNSFMRMHKRLHFKIIYAILMIYA